MTKAFTSIHRERMTEMKKKLSELGNKESSFIGIELLFYEALTMARSYGNDPSENLFLAALKIIEVNEFQVSKEFYKKSTQREHAIRKFSAQFKNTLTRALKNQYIADKQTS